MIQFACHVGALIPSEHRPEPGRGEAGKYDAEIGRWTNKDPIGFAGQQGNVYEYVGGDPVNGVDRNGMDVWIEGPSGGEPAGHLSISIGDPNGAYRSFSYGATSPLRLAWPIGVRGSVYEDKKVGGVITSYLKTSVEEDKELTRNLKALVDGPNPFVEHGGAYTFGNVCRDFSREVWAIIRESGAGTPALPPATLRDNSTSSDVPVLASTCQD